MSKGDKKGSAPVVGLDHSSDFASQIVKVVSELLWVLV